VPWYVTAFMKLIGPFIDPVTSTKIKRNEPLVDHVPAAQLMKASGGDVDFKYDHGVYWPALEKLTSERRQQRQERWEKAGKPLGESEIYLWGGDERSVAGQKEEAEVSGEAQVGEKINDEAPPNHTAKAVGETELVDGVANLDIKQSEPVKAAA
jgi:hypothetical protein